MTSYKLQATSYKLQVKSYMCVCSLVFNHKQLQQEIAAESGISTSFDQSKDKG